MMPTLARVCCVLKLFTSLPPDRVRVYRELQLGGTLKALDDGGYQIDLGRDAHKTCTPLFLECAGGNLCYSPCALSAHARSCACDCAGAKCTGGGAGSRGAGRRTGQPLVRGARAVGRSPPGRWQWRGDAARGASGRAGVHAGGGGLARAAGRRDGGGLRCQHRSVRAVLRGGGGALARVRLLLRPQVAS